MLGLDRVALLLARQNEERAPAPATAEMVTGRDLGEALAEARAKRATGARVRFGNGEDR
jgi:hypothetical protein